MLNRLLPREDSFFTLFNKLADEMKQGAEALDALFADMHDIQAHVRAVEAAEQRADKTVSEIGDLLHGTFITPFDRDQIQLLVTRMDDVIDLTEDVAQTILLYDVTRLTPETLTLQKLCVESVEKIRSMVALLSDMKNAKTILALADDIKKIEEKTDYVMRAAIAKLFREESDYREFIKMKEIYELLETVTDRADDVADIARGVVLEHT